jgi:glyoxylase-like metal-dependent hydrolase (beta-lactamase superfamily II)
MPASPTIQAFFDEPTNTVSYLVADPETGLAAVIDPVLDYDHAAGEARTTSADRILAAAQNLKITWLLETHAHADHLSSAPYLRAKTGARIGIGTHITEVQKIFRPIFNMAADGADFDHLFEEGETFALGTLSITVLATPGHTPADVTYLINDAAFVGDTLFMPDYGTARADFPGGDARQLYRSIQKLLALPPQTRLFTCHDYQAPDRNFFAWESSVGEQAKRNIHVRHGISEAEFVAMRTARDATLSTPKLLLPAIQVNIRAGKLPQAAGNGVSYLMIPVTFNPV